MRGRSVKLRPLVVRTNSFQFTLPSLFSAPKTSLGKRHHHVIDLFRELFNIDPAAELRPPARRSARPATRAARSYAGISKRSHPQLRLLISRTYSGLVGHFTQNCSAHKSRYDQDFTP